MFPHLDLRDTAVLGAFLAFWMHAFYPSSRCIAVSKGFQISNKCNKCTLSDLSYTSYVSNIFGHNPLRCNILTSTTHKHTTVEIPYTPLHSGRPSWPSHWEHACVVVVLLVRPERSRGFSRVMQVLPTDIFRGGRPAAPIPDDFTSIIIPPWLGTSRT